MDVLMTSEPKTPPPYRLCQARLDCGQLVMRSNDLEELLQDMLWYVGENTAKQYTDLHVSQEPNSDFVARITWRNR